MTTPIAQADMPPQRRGIIDKDTVSGLAFAGLGAFALWSGRDYDTGSVVQMGPGFFPAMMAWSCIGLSCLIVAKALLSRQRAALATKVQGQIVSGDSPEAAASQPRIDPRAFGFVLAGIVAFAILLEPVGLILATLALVLLVSAARKGMRPLGAITLAAGLAASAALLFSVALGLPLRLWPF